MSLFNRRPSKMCSVPAGLGPVNVGRAKTGFVLGIAGLAIVLAGCTVQPLYSSAPSSQNTAVSADIRSKLASIAIDPADAIFAQEVRNRLIFGLSGGAGEPAQPRYNLALGLQMFNESAVEVDVGDTTTGRASAGTVRLRSDYTLRDRNGQVVASGRRSVSASYDRPRQEFANLRAKRNAEQRAAEELAQFLVLSLAQDMQKLP